jgi:hypothetical protein
MLDDSSVLSEIYSPGQRARAVDLLSASPVALEKISLWRKKAGGAGNKTVLVELDEYREKQMRAKARVAGLMILLILYYI